jgi:hypothetical protein
VQNCGNNPDFNLFLKRKSGGPSPRVVDRTRVVGPRSTVDLTVADGRSSPELSLAAAPGQGDLLRRHGRQKGGVGTLVEGSPRAEGR